MYRKRLSFFRSSIRSRYPQSTSSTARSGNVASVAGWLGDSMITSWAPIPFILSKRPSPSRSSSPSIPSAGNLFGTTRMFQPGVFAPPPFRPYTRISGGVFASFPEQNGQFFASFATTLSRRKSFGRFPRSVEMITQRPVIGSFRNSGKASLLESALKCPRGESTLPSLYCTASGADVKLCQQYSLTLEARTHPCAIVPSAAAPGGYLWPRHQSDKGTPVPGVPLGNAGQCESPRAVFPG